MYYSCDLSFSDTAPRSAPEICQFSPADEHLWYWTMYRSGTQGGLPEPVPAADNAGTLRLLQHQTGCPSCVFHAADHSHEPAASDLPEHDTGLHLMEFRISRFAVLVHSQNSPWQLHIRHVFRVCVRGLSPHAGENAAQAPALICTGLSPVIRTVLVLSGPPCRRACNCHMTVA